MLEHGIPGRYSNFTYVQWYQQASQDQHGDMWAVDRQRHQVVVMRKVSKYGNITWPSLYEVYAGKDRAGYYDGSIGRAKFNGPQGIAAFSEAVYSAEGEVSYKVMLYVADTANHCIREINTTSQRTKTLAGLPSAPGLVDGQGTKAKFFNPTSIGVGTSGDIFVLDNHRLVRRLDRSGYVTTLVNGACRELKRYNIWVSVMVRVVLCHPDWLMQDTAEEIEVFGASRMCIGHQATCGARNHPAILDEKSPFLLDDEGDSIQFQGPTAGANLEQVQVNLGEGVVEDSTQSTGEQAMAAGADSYDSGGF